MLTGFVRASNAIGPAETLYNRTDYESSLRLLKAEPSPDLASYMLMGKNYFMLGDYPNAVKFFENAVLSDARCSPCELWLARTFGKLAETNGWLHAMPNASRARRHFEKAVELDPRNAEAMNDLFDYYLNAPELIGGGLDKAEKIARQIAASRPPESHFEMAEILEKRKQYAETEAHLRSAMELAPGQAGRVLDLARFLARRGRIAESDSVFEQASQLAPGDPRVIYARAKSYVEQHRNLEEARALLRQYVTLNLTPDDPPRSAAQKLLQQAGAK